MAGKAGQGRKFQMDDVLEAATLVFWRYGYEGATLSELTEAMGIKPPSLYKAFGSKEGLFFEVVKHYNETHGSFMSKAFAEESDGHALIRRLLLEAAEYYPASRFPGGCLVISATVGVSRGNTHLAAKLAEMRNDNIIELSKRNGVTLATARFVGATLQGMSQQARDGASTEDLRGIACMAIAALGIDEARDGNGDRHDIAQSADCGAPNGQNSRPELEGDLMLE